VSLSIGVPVVHIDYGVGRYQGLMTLDIDGQTQEFLQLIYADSAKLYVPVANLHLIARYSGSEDSSAPLHKLAQSNGKKRVKKPPNKCTMSPPSYLALAHAVPLKQVMPLPLMNTNTINLVQVLLLKKPPTKLMPLLPLLADMRAPRPMDRLVCGDVGFGKTEVAMRAAFVAIHAGKQVAVLVPTTLLAQQHYENFCDRFADWPVKIDVLSRFKTAKEQNKALESLENGQIDIIIGTHKLLQDSVQFKDLGLMIVDEEHRFGVRHKEALKIVVPMWICSPSPPPLFRVP
jgi:transcription-repair coupling factor (superfamily II helicase)